MTLLGTLSRVMAKGGMAKPSFLVKPVSVTKIPGRYLAHQESLPKLPVPPLKQTCDRYLTALEPIVDEEQLKHTRRLLEEFQLPGEVGERLQKSLERRASKLENWLSDWWLKTAYLDYRMPVVVHSSPGVVLPRLEFNDHLGQIRYAASLIAGVLDFKTMIDNQTLPVEYLGGKPLCMNQYYQILSSCRIPGITSDSVVNHASSSRPPTYITVVRNFQFFVLDVYHNDGTPLTVDQLYTQLEKICNSSPQPSEDPIGILTSNHRDSWGKAYANLIKDRKNKESVQKIQTSIFIVCLDSPMPRVADKMYHTRAALQMLHGGGSQWNSGNRWFDKTLQFIIGEDGTCGLIYEHAPAEGPPIVALIDHVVEYTKKSEMISSPLAPLPVPQKLRFNITPEIKSDIEEAKQNMNLMVHDLDAKVVVFTHFGKNVPKSYKMSPDAFIQVALQLAYYRMYKRCCATYESASLRMFKLGRTDTIRSASIDSANFVRAMDDPVKQHPEKVTLLEKAVKAHRAYTDMAIHGQAIDRHLLGLKLQAVEELSVLPEIFKDKSYASANHYKLSTSQVPAKTDCVMCFGPVVPDGYGVCYNPMEKHINFAVSSFNSCADTSATHLAHALEGALLDMKRLLDQTLKSKL
ncbi:carnitine O-acetyltransferase isoform X1 [Clarias gariepinus]|uniref:carnitine O-acetyltransferase isoform X1 n=2 Tax=Clarias gariepinus TaxID=13013 RepID=UPI00234E07FA|nr:carnitine O-acetyltransferase isoform X1 [Clarias gariepinus]